MTNFETTLHLRDLEAKLNVREVLEETSLAKVASDQNPLCMILSILSQE